MNGLEFLMSNNQQNHHFYGVSVGIVTNNKDPEGLGRIKVKFPWLSGEEESYWARVVSLMAGNNRGIYFLPEVDDEVLVAFEQGDMAFPYILGTLWNGKDKPPVKNDDGKNNQRMIKSRSGHMIVLDDTDGEEKIIIQDKTGKNQIVINSKENTMNIKVEKDLTIETKGKIILKSSNDDISIECKNLSIKTQQNYKLEAGANCSIKAKAKYELEAKSGLGIKCSAGVKVNDGALEVM
ncbi:phage baseplate assembly protein V [Calothrix sp. PCC 7507]|uniref:phage baseplate assembly protein V n=1 Tax=Calothrix sp. PCC 7507 TaxID=99598 RepID=UPI00029F357C|nr:phage baseplate assembly protein V [Calothrix sp. PCC 7507]AFY33614.1 rhs element Vgr protein [Calothrix sp. PCC 7507]